MPLPKLSIADAAVDRVFDVGKRIRERERHFVHAVRPGLGEMPAADVERPVRGQVLRAIFERVGDEPQRRGDRENEIAARGVLLEYVVLQVAADLGEIGALLFRQHDVHREYDRRGRVDHRADEGVLELDALEYRFPVAQRADRSAGHADFAARHRMVGIQPQLRRQVERHIRRHAAVGYHLAEQHIGFARAAESRVMADRPQFLAVARRVDAARERIFARETDVLVEIGLGVGWRVDHLERNAVLAGGVLRFRLDDFVLMAFLPLLFRALQILYQHGNLLGTAPGACQHVVSMTMSMYQIK